ncbi:ABC transporter permease [Paenibacillus baekrokdamisoli]|uniref:ABC transporter permease n=1 Tax=Paenibacillus baekrokdamisoli TaxID=1712516 RepID=A0A3G9IPX3_9BACL|nr:carbohydrate ABC transporter permease [Paenibacillus baekrokdamisoli]MBB3072020.1 ABC-type glycerol-3-phosphate transport system permease component [Paenibacillus baekrokdamisoli]BBH20322.1 ABC transporter permease [Paenibacillus baekrokdamisoli]
MTVQSWLRTLRRKLKLDVFQVISIIGLIGLGLFMLLPVLFVFSQAFKPISELFAYPPRFVVSHPTLFNFQQLFLQSQTVVVPFTRYLFNSIITTSLTVGGIIMVCAMAAFAFSKLTFPGSKAINSLIIVSLMFAPESVGIPRYLVITHLGIMDTYFAHILPLIAMPVGVFLLKQFVDQVPNELLEAAKMDGAREFTIFFRIILPMCLPATATVGILAFQASWAQTETSNLYVTIESMKTLPYYVATLTNGAANNVVGQGIAAAAGLIIFVPNIIFFLLAQRKVMATMAHSGIK